METATAPGGMREDALERCARERILAVIRRSTVPEDPAHAENTLAWLLRLAPGADLALRIAALAHDIDRALPEGERVRRADFDDYDAFKAAHARNGARVLERILRGCGAPEPLVREACRLVARHESGGDARADLLRDADSLSFYDTNLPLYLAREGEAEALRRARWGWRRLSPRARALLAAIRHGDPAVDAIIERVLAEGAGAA